MTREVIVGATADWAAIMKPPSRRVWPTARAPTEVMLSLTTRRAIPLYDDDTVELSMKAPMSVSKPGDLGRGSRTMRLRLMVTGGWGHDVYLGSGPRDGGNTLLPA